MLILHKLVINLILMKRPNNILICGVFVSFITSLQISKLRPPRSLTSQTDDIAFYIFFEILMYPYKQRWLN